MLSVTAFDDPASFSDPHYQTHADATLEIAAEYGVLDNDVGLDLEVTSHDTHSHYGAAVTVHGDGSVVYDPADLSIFKSLSAGETLVDTFTYSVSGGAVSDGLFAIEGFQLAPATGANDHDLDSASETLAIWNALDLGVAGPGMLTIGSKTYFVSRYESDLDARVNYGSGGGTAGGAGRFVSNLTYESIHGDGPGGSAGTLTGGEDFSVRARTFVTFDVAGTYTLAVGSDDGRRLALSYADNFPVPFQTAGGQLTGFQPGDSVIRFEGTTGHLWSLGVFSVQAGDVLALDAFFFERTAADSFEIAIKSGSDTMFGNGTDGFVLLADEVLGGTIHLSSTLAPPVPEVDTATVTVHVTGVNDAPVADGSNLSVHEDGSVTGLLVARDPDSDGAPHMLQYSLAGDPPPAGQLQVHEDGTFTFDTAGGFNALPAGSTANVSFTFIATDQHGASSTPATVTIRVDGSNDAPLVVSPVSDVAVNQNSSPTTIELSGRVTDPDAGDTVSYVAVSSDTRLVQASVVGSKLVLSFLPNANGLASVTVTASDRWGSSASHSFSVQVRSPREQVNIMIQQLGTLQTSGVLSTGEANALEKKLAEGLKQLEKPQIKAGINMLQAFNNQVRALVRSGRLSASQGSQLIDWSNGLITSVGG